MIFKRFYLGVIIQVLLIAITCCLVAYLKFHTNMVYLPFHFVIILCIQVWLLIRYANNINIKIKEYLNSVLYDDISASFSNKFTDKSFSELNHIFQKISKKQSIVHKEKEIGTKYHEYIFNHVDIGLISFCEKGDVELFNYAGKNILGIKEMYNISVLDNIYKGFSKILKDIRPGQYKLLKMNIDGELLHLSIKSTDIIRPGKKSRIISFQNIKNELEDNELDSWQKIIRVLTHEIMNSIAPITSATSTLINFFMTNGKAKTPDKITKKIICDSLEGLNAINLRGEGLMGFVDKYRSLTLLPKPNFEIIRISLLLKNIQLLLNNELIKNKIKFELNVIPEDLEFTGDPKMVDQVILNILRNSIQALQNSENRRIWIEASLYNEKTIIKVNDNGIGISAEDNEKVFIPFFTTKEGGSGIGLSLSRQIMRLHGGTISIRSVPNIETVVGLEF
ncbi:PAS domain-containing sensor histidine kinase [Bacteroidota bacterium]